MSSKPQNLRIYTRFLGLCSLAVLPLSACVSSGNGDSNRLGGQTGDEVMHTIQKVEGTVARRDASGTPATSASSELAEFAWDFYAESRVTDENFVYSPLSLAIAASMLYAGTEAGTADEMGEVFSFATESEDFHQARNVLLQALSSRNREASEEDSAQALRISNDFWMAERLVPEPEFLNVLSEFYGAPVHLFEGSLEDVRTAINQKVSRDTNALIDELLPPGALPPDAIFVLTNALYFKANWLWTFQEDGTKKAPFETVDGSSSQVDMMSAGEFEYRYAATEEAEILSMPYQGAELEFVAIMPTAGSFQSFSEDLTAQKVAQLSEAMSYQNLLLRFPKMRVAYELPLKEELIEAGMVEAFREDEADFMPLTKQKVWLAKAFHQAEVVLDEEGTEAAAATAFVGVDESAGPVPIEVTFDRPFLFFIRDIESEAVLFLGHYVAPD